MFLERSLNVGLGMNGYFTGLSLIHRKPFGILHVHMDYYSGALLDISRISYFLFVVLMKMWKNNVFIVQP